MTTDKNKLHQLIDECNNDVVLAEVNELLTSENIKDWWEELTEEDKTLLMESEADYEKGNFITHNNLMQQFEAWRKK